MKIINKYIINKVTKYCDLDKINKSILSSNDIVDINTMGNIEKLELIVNVEIINNIRRINKFHEEVNEILVKDGIYVSCLETLEERKKRVKKKAIIGFKKIFLFLDFIYKRVIPKLPIVKTIYFAITNGHNRVLSKAESLGRLISCGFQILEYFEFENILYVISKKSKSPEFDMNPSYGPLFKMKRIGKNGKIIGVYKIRTMHPYSEYCQDLITKENKLAESGKIAHDFRITYWGKIFRKYWIDELPMIINFLKGEITLVGVRPLSVSYFSRYPNDLQKLRIQIKPGLIPPYYADMPKNFEEILLSERKYINQKLKYPITTDIAYFFKVFFNIFFKGARSK